MVHVGRIARFDEVRGYGFITPDEGGPDVFV
ncbi:cold shock domain-containing protein, partial [Micromonospora aurantiaca]|nr:cold shock domain-containing protein [Micromonospora aurantiaca]